MSYEFWVGCAIVLLVGMGFVLLSMMEVKLRENGYSGISPKKEK